jgi:alpha-L-rhamnosidase
MNRRRFLQTGLAGTQALSLPGHARWLIRGAGLGRLRAYDLQSEQRRSPDGLDVRTPLLSWRLTSTQDGTTQSAYQVLVASSEELLLSDKVDRWDSGVLRSDATGVTYAGLPLQSRDHLVWRVKVWDQEGIPFVSEPSSFTIGLLSASDWSAEWIADPVLADAANRPRTPIHCYRSTLALRSDSPKWVMLDLGAVVPVDAVRIMPARPEAWSGDLPSFLYPVRFRIEASQDAAFTQPVLLVDRTSTDMVSPHPHFHPIPTYSFAVTHARYLRLTATRLAYWDNGEYGMALSWFEVFHAGKEIAADASVQASDSIDTDVWSSRYLVDRMQKPLDGPIPSVLPVQIEGIPGSRTVSRGPYLRRTFHVDSTVRRATLYITARGFYECWLNGQRVGDELFAPGYTNLADRLQVQRHDITAHVHPGANAIGALLGYGWYAGHMNLHEERYHYGYYPQLLAQLEIELTDGSAMRIRTDEHWRSTLNGPVLWSDILDGEAIDYRKDFDGWNTASYDDAVWKPVSVLARDTTPLVWQRCPPVRAGEILEPASITTVRPGVHVVDFGQEISGWVRLRGGGPAGTKIQLRHTEAVYPDGNVDDRSLWGVAQQDDYILDGRSDRTLEPHFTWHGFRYVEITGLPHPPDAADLRAVSLHSDYSAAGTFESSDRLLNRMMIAAKWTQQNMMFDIPIGCAARAERVGWMGDIRPCAQTNMLLFDSASFLAKYLIDMRDAQDPEGRFSDITPASHPRLLDPDVAGSPGWSDAGVSIAWQHYGNYGDLTTLRQHYPDARRWVEFVAMHNPDGIWKNERGLDWGDWLSSGSPPTPVVLGSTAFFAHSAAQLTEMAKALGKTADHDRFSRLAASIRAAFVKKFVSADGYIEGDVQGSYALALYFDMVTDPALRELVIHRLVELVGQSGGHPATGFWSNNAVLFALSNNGHHALAESMVHLRSEPSFGYILDNGGTTFWEYWDTQKADTVLSRNHWPLSSVGEWIWATAAGLQPDPSQPGYRSFFVRPRPSVTLSWCKASYESIRGRIEIDWSVHDRHFTLRLTVPPGSNATLTLPGTLLTSSISDRRILSRGNDIVTLQAGAGKHNFTSLLSS